MRNCPFIFIALLVNLLFGGAHEARGFTKNQPGPASFHVFADGQLVKYGYAAAGARLWKWDNQAATNLQVWIGNIYEEKGGKVLYHVYAGGQLVCSYETNSTLFGGSDTNRVAYYYHEDNLNSSTTLSSGGTTGTQIEVDAYYPFGRVQTASPQASFKVSRQFTGQVKDDDTGLYYYNGRYYDPLLGRFIQADTTIPDMGNPQSYNRYSYCLNNPLKYTDPSGHIVFVLPALYAGGTALAVYGIDHLYWNGRIAANNMATAEALDRIAASTGKYDDYNDFLANKKNPSVVSAGTPEQRQAAIALGDAAGDAVLTASTMMVPELRGAAVLKTEEKLYRGVPGNGTEKANLGAQGIAKPRGSSLDPAEIERHVEGANANAGVTSWTPDRSVAKRFSGNNGTIIEVNKSAVADKIVPRPPIQKNSSEKEVLLKGTIQGKPTTP